MEWRERDENDGERASEQRREERERKRESERVSEIEAELATSQKHERLSIWILPLSQTCIRQARPPCPRTK